MLAWFREFENILGHHLPHVTQSKKGPYEPHTGMLYLWCVLAAEIIATALKHNYLWLALFGNGIMEENGVMKYV